VGNGKIEMISRNTVIEKLTKKILQDKSNNTNFVTGNIKLLGVEYLPHHCIFS
jgi:hypothetical protein